MKPPELQQVLSDLKQQEHTTQQLAEAYAVGSHSHLYYTGVAYGLAQARVLLTIRFPNEESKNDDNVQTG